uniref:Uncharacterized protein n=1 Tax=Ceratocystis fimbriata TaxID=5158 RepID=X4YZ71_9PEZI|nr:hypothetical protein [Ceratocystis fimbriata]AHV84695.1 hypothetical protein [Ceratocystis fimbriata]
MAPKRTGNNKNGDGHKKNGENGDEKHRVSKPHSRKKDKGKSSLIGAQGTCASESTDRGANSSGGSEKTGVVYYTAFSRYRNAFPYLDENGVLRPPKSPILEFSSSSGTAGQSAQPANTASPTDPLQERRAQAQQGQAQAPQEALSQESQPLHMATPAVSSHTSSEEQHQHQHQHQHQQQQQQQQQQQHESPRPSSETASTTGPRTRHSSYRGYQQQQQSGSSWPIRATDSASTAEPSSGHAGQQEQPQHESPRPSSGTASTTGPHALHTRHQQHHEEVHFRRDTSVAGSSQHSSQQQPRPGFSAGGYRQRTGNQEPLGRTFVSENEQSTSRQQNPALQHRQYPNYHQQQQSSGANNAAERYGHHITNLQELQQRLWTPDVASHTVSIHHGHPSHYEETQNPPQSAHFTSDGHYQAPHSGSYVSRAPPLSPDGSQASGAGHFPPGGHHQVIHTTSYVSRPPPLFSSGHHQQSTSGAGPLPHGSYHQATANDAQQQQVQTVSTVSASCCAHSSTQQHEQQHPRLQDQQLQPPTPAPLSGSGNDQNTQPQHNQRPSVQNTSEVTTTSTLFPSLTDIYPPQPSVGVQTGSPHSYVYHQVRLQSMFAPPQEESQRQGGHRDPRRRTGQGPNQSLNHGSSQNPRQN